MTSSRAVSLEFPSEEPRGKHGEFSGSMLCTRQSALRPLPRAPTLSRSTSIPHAGQQKSFAALRFACQCPQPGFGHVLDEATAASARVSPSSAEHF